MALDLKKAIEIARTYFLEYLPYLITGEAPRVEEIEREGSGWAITLSVPDPDSVSNQYRSTPYGRSRVAKIIVVSGENGEFVALRHRAA